MFSTHRPGGLPFSSFALCLISTLSILSAVSEAASVDCEAILRDGVFDKHRVRHLSARIAQAKSALCGFTESSQSFSVEAHGKLAAVDQEALCTGSDDYLATNSNAEEIIDRANSLILNTFNECAIQNIGGVSHGIFTTDDPSVFTYQVQFTPDASKAAETFVEVDSFEVHNTSCRPPLAAESEIDQGKRTFICTRDPAESVIIALNTLDNRGTKYLQPIRLNAFTESQTPYPIRADEQDGQSEEAVTHPYRRFKARRQLSESTCSNPSLELNFEEKTQVKLIGKAVAQGKNVPYPLWIQIEVDGDTQCERQAWPTRRGSVEKDCLVWVEANTPTRVTAIQTTKDATCIGTQLDVWH
jgi:hypothetical protein